MASTLKYVLYWRVVLTSSACHRAERHGRFLPVVQRLSAGLSITATDTATVNFLHGAYLQVAAHALKHKDVNDN
jgi:hypothetical protein